MLNKLSFEARSPKPAKKKDASRECGSEEAAEKVLGVLTHPIPLAILLGLALFFRRRV